MRKTSDKLQLTDILLSRWSVLVKNVKVIEIKESLRDRHSQEDPKQTWPRNVMCYPGWNPETEKEYQVENYGNLKKIYKL